MPNVFTPVLRELQQKIDERPSRITIFDFARFDSLMDQLRQLADQPSSNTQHLYSQCVALINNIHSYYPGIVGEPLKEYFLQKLARLLESVQRQRLHHPQLLGPLQAPQARYLENLAAVLLRMHNPQQHPREEQYQREHAQPVQAQAHAVQMTQVLHAHGIIESDALEELRSIIGGNLIRGPVVVLQDGENRHYYAREELVAWLARKQENPMTRQPLRAEDLVDATEEYRTKVREIIMQALADRPESERTQIVSLLFEQFGWSRSANPAAARAHPR